MSDALLAQIWAELAAAPADRAHPWRHPVLATVGIDGAPDARTVVMRSADRTAGTLMCFTDARSPKVAQLRRDARAVLVFWHPGLRWQLRVSGTVQVITEGPAVAAAWQRVARSAGAADYLSAAAPGSPLHDGVAPAGATHHLGLLQTQVQSIDWLALGDGTPHQRVLFQQGTARPLVP